MVNSYLPPCSLTHPGVDVPLRTVPVVAWPRVGTATRVVAVEGIRGSSTEIQAATRAAARLQPVCVSPCCASCVAPSSSAARLGTNPSPVTPCPSPGYVRDTVTQRMGRAWFILIIDRRLQPYVLEAAILCVGGDDPVHT
eukprot:scaffold101453_cov58-Phaeocystis_antarctica.AAC.2